MFSGSALCLAGVALLSCPPIAVAQAATHTPNEQAPAASPLHFPSNEEMREFRTVRGVDLSPDAKSVVAAILDSTADGGKSHLWLIDVAGGAPRQLTYSADSDKSGERDPNWMPDGQSVLFLAHRGEHTSLFRLPMQGGEAKAYDLKVTPLADISTRSDAVPLDALKKEDAKTASEAAASQGSKTAEKKPSDPPTEPIAVDVSGYAIAPDGHSVALLIRDPQTPGEKRQNDAKADAQWVDHDPHAERLYLLDPSTGKLTLTAALADVQNFAWSPDSTHLLVISEAPNGVDDLYPAHSLSILTAVHPSEPELVKEVPPTVDAAQWAKDGGSIVYLAKSKLDAPPGVNDLYEYSLTTKNTADLSAGVNGTTASGPITRPGGETDQLIEVGTNVVLARFRAGNTTPELVHAPTSVLDDLHTNQRQTGWVFLGSDAMHPPSLYFAEQLGSAPRTLALPRLTPDNLQLAPAKPIHWKNDRLNLEGLLYMPAVPSGQKVPLVVEAHGGPTEVASDRFYPFALFLLGQGWAVFCPNPRGSTGYGATFAAANKNDLGGADFRDLMTGVDFLLKSEPIDSSRMALIGYSYGGEMAGFAESRTDRFRAIVSAAPVIDQFSEYGTEEGSIYDRWYYGYPWKHPEDAWRQSPLAGIDHAKTPLLLIQGESDTNDPLGQSQEMYRALRQNKVPVELITYPRENHAPLAIGIYGGSSTEPWHGYDARARMVSFIRDHFAAATSSGSAAATQKTPHGQ